ncbi:hypothetical protein [Streptomyces sp. NPDC001815]|uniref:hypothetical protein n=1 Tax=Streptomyces sp. NPDC001815 TaxID=3154526 RepID=UPI003329DF62
MQSRLMAFIAVLVIIAVAGVTAGFVGNGSRAVVLLLCGVVCGICAITMAVLMARGPRSKTVDRTR